MRFRAKATQSKTTRARAVLGLLALVSLNLAAQPCVVAASTSPDDATTRGAPLHSDAAEQRQADTHPKQHGDCPHCAFSGHQSRADTFQCAGLDATSADSTVNAKGEPASVWVAAASVQAFNTLQFVAEAAIDPPGNPPTAQPTLIKRFCVYRI